MGDEKFTVAGESWFDHEWATNQLAPGQAGWNWVSAQFEDESELMLYQMRLTNGAIDPISSGTLVRADGTSLGLTSADFEMTPTSRFGKARKRKRTIRSAGGCGSARNNWNSPSRRSWRTRNWFLRPLIYWEGAFDIDGTRAGKPIRGRGYLELTGYAAPLQGLNR